MVAQRSGKVLDGKDVNNDFFANFFAVRLGSHWANSPLQYSTFRKLSRYLFSCNKVAGQSRKLAVFFFVSKFHVLDLLQNFDCGNAVKKRKLNWQAVTLGIQRQFRVVNTTRNPKLVKKFLIF